MQRGLFITTRAASCPGKTIPGERFTTWENRNGEEPLGKKTN